MRAAVVRLHRWFGLGAAAFLLVAALTGAVLPWQHELDAWLNPQLFTSRGDGEPQAPLELAASIERTWPDKRVTYIPLVSVPGEAQAFGVEPRAGLHNAPSFDEVFIDPVTGRITGTREWGRKWPIGHDNLMPFLYVLHYSLHLPGTWGTWLLGVVALLWALDCFAGLYLTLPVAARNDSGSSSGLWWRRWSAAWRVRMTGGFRLLFDLHRAPALWTWLLVLILAFTSFALNLYGEIFRPALASVASLTPSPYDVREPGPAYRAREPAADFADVLEKARIEGQARGWDVPPGDIFHAHAYGFYRLKFFDAQHPHGENALGEAMLFYDDVTGELIGDITPGTGTAGDLVVQLQFPLHSGHIAGTTGRVVVSLLGVVTSLLVVTGLLIWWRKRTARRDPGAGVTA